MVNILKEDQTHRDRELANIFNMNFEDIQKIPIAQGDSIILSEKNKPKSEADYIDIYSMKSYKDLVGHFKTLMFTSIQRRHRELFKLIGRTQHKTCLDFGCGVGTHGISLMERGNKVFFLDVMGVTTQFLERRLQERSLSAKVVDTKYNFKEKMFDVIICTNVLEHVYDPVSEISRITRWLKPGGILHIQVSNMIKPRSGHFPESIQQWNRFGKKYLNRYYKRNGKTLYKRLNNGVYDKYYYNRYRKKYDAFSKFVVPILMKEFDPDSVVDIGCGLGLYLKVFKENGVYVKGVDCSEVVIKSSPIRSYIVKADLNNKFPKLGKFDLCICTEVAEHLSKKNAYPLIKYLCKLAPVVFFSAAKEGQNGSGHINCQNKRYWIKLFEKNGYKYDDVITLKLKNEISKYKGNLRYNWFYKNFGVYHA